MQTSTCLCIRAHACTCTCTCTVHVHAFVLTGTTTCICIRIWHRPVTSLKLSLCSFTCITPYHQNPQEEMQVLSLPSPGHIRALLLNRDLPITETAICPGYHHKAYSEKRAWKVITSRVVKQDSLFQNYQSQYYNCLYTIKQYLN